MESYIIRKINNHDINSEDIWKSISKMEIGFFPWDINGYKPKTEVQMFYTESYFKLRLSSHEKKVKATYINLNENVFEDSCMEVFLIPDALGENKYMNFEFNAFGTLLFGIGSDRPTRVRLGVDSSIFDIKASLNPDNLSKYNADTWTVEFKIPFDFIEKHYGKIDFIPGHRLKANFYKCGDKTEYPHYGCWNQIINETPNFHLPQFFGDLILE